MLNALTVDVEDYFQVSAFAGVIPRAAWPDWPARVEDNTRRLLDLFAGAGVRATFFTLGWVAARHPALVRAIVAGGHELASHGRAHYRVWEQTPAEFAADVTAARRTLEDIGGVAVRGYRAASFSIDARTWWAFDVLAEAGYHYSSSLHPIRHDHYGMPDAPRFPFRPSPSGVTEIPVATLAFAGRRWPCAGGGFFRVLPYGWTRRALARINRAEDRPAVFYLHPWEIDPDQPRVPGAPLRARLRHYANLHRTAGRLGRLLGDFAWAPMTAVFPEAAGGPA